jgi:FlaG/FlaF family flagellin (archaellin)
VAITDNASGSSQSVALSGTGTLAAPTVSPASLSFGSQAAGTSSSAQTVTLKNNAASALSIGSISITGTNPGSFTQTNTCGATVAAKASCTISVKFAPVVSALRSASLTITDSASGSPQSVALSGTGTLAAPTLSPPSLSFSSQAAGTTSSAQTVTLKNNSLVALSIGSIAITGANPGSFTQTNTCGASVAAGAGCTISVKFAPVVSALRSGSLTITDSATGSPQSVALSGTGTLAAPTLSPPSLSFSSQAAGTTSSAQTVTLKNNSLVALSIGSIALTGTSPGSFTQTNTCGATVAAGASCTISVKFAPAAATPSSAAITITDSATGSPQTVALSGTGKAPH